MGNQIDAGSLKGLIADEMQQLREAGSADDHPFGAWSGGSKSSGGHAGGGKGQTERSKALDKAGVPKDSPLRYEKADADAPLTGLTPQAALQKGGLSKGSATQLQKDLSSNDTMTRQKAEFTMAVATNRDSWVAGASGTEMPFQTRAGNKVQRVYNPKQQEHGYLDFSQDRVFTDKDLAAAGKTYPGDASKLTSRSVKSQVAQGSKFSITKANIAKQNAGLSFKQKAKPFNPRTETYKQFKARSK